MENEILKSIIAKYEKFDEVEAIALGGSSIAKSSDSISDIDIYVFVNGSLVGRNSSYGTTSNFHVGIQYIIPHGATYSVGVDGGTLDKWIELR